MQTVHDLSTLRSPAGGTASPHAPHAAPAPQAPSAVVPPPTSRWKTRILLPAAVLLAAAGVLAWSARDAFTPAIEVQVAPAVVRAGSVSVGGGVVAQAPGWVEPDPYAVTVPVLADGVVQDVLVLEGQSVKADQVLVQLIDADARLALAKAEAELASAQAEVTASELALGAARSATQPGQAARTGGEGAALAETLRELERQPVEVARMQAKLEELRAELEAKQRAQKDGLVSQVQVTLLEARLRSAQAELASQQAQEHILRARLGRMEIEARAALAKAQAARDSAQAARDEARLRLQRMQVRSPIDGTVMSRNVEPGTAVMNGRGRSGELPAVRLYDPRKLQVRVDVPLAQAARVGVGQQAQVVVDVLPDQTFTGKVTRVVHEADIQRNTLQFKVAIENPSPQVKPEMLARVKFIAPTTTAAAPASSQRLFVPASVLTVAPGQSMTLLVADPARNVALARSVTVGAGRADDWAEVASGLNPGDRVIVAAPPGLKEGDKIRILESSQAAPSAGPAKTAPHSNHTGGR